MRDKEPSALMTRSEVALAGHVTPKTVSRWAKAGKLTSIRTLGGHRRFRADEVRAFLASRRVKVAPAATDSPVVDS